MMEKYEFLDKDTTNGSDNIQLEEDGIRYKVKDRLQYENARKMRKEYTEAEGILWIYLRNNQLAEKFRRQHPVENFIVDFICLKKQLIIEIDGDYHDSQEQILLDNERTKVLNSIGFSVIRFTNEQVLYDISGVITKIKDCLLACK